MDTVVCQTANRGLRSGRRQTQATVSRSVWSIREHFHLILVKLKEIVLIREKPGLKKPGKGFNVRRFPRLKQLGLLQIPHHEVIKCDILVVVSIVQKVVFPMRPFVFNRGSTSQYRARDFVRLLHTHSCICISVQEIRRRQAVLVDSARYPVWGCSGFIAGNNAPELGQTRRPQHVHVHVAAGIVGNLAAAGHRRRLAIKIRGQFRRRRRIPSIRGGLGVGEEGAKGVGDRVDGHDDLRLGVDVEAGQESEKAAGRAARDGQAGPVYDVLAEESREIVTNKSNAVLDVLEDFADADLWRETIVG